MTQDLWYKNAVIYSLDLESFMDANGDGVGDFDGLMRRLDYLHSLGVDALWLAPFQPTPNRDNGYDISDFYGVDARHGSSGDFVAFMHAAKQRGLKVLIDLVVNHTSDEHGWFQAAREQGSGKRDWYVWEKERPSDWDTGMVFPGVQQATWTFDKKAGAYYFHRFHKFQPDLNMENSEVRAEIQRIMGYWLELGVAGFRVDAVPFILETPAPGAKKHELRFEYLEEMRDFLDWRSSGAILLGEANVMPEATRPYFGETGGGIQMMFNFYVNQHLFYALATADVKPLAEALEATRNIPQTAQWGQFLRNHDELDLGRLTGAQREKVFARFAPEKDMQIYGRGVRRRLAPMLGERSQLELAYSLVFSLPGTPVLRYGDEIGMGDDLSLGGRDAFRTPMQWSGEAQAGFSDAETTVLPVIERGVYGSEHVNVEAQRRDPGSLLNWTARMIRLRRECPEIGWGEFTVLETGLETVLALRYDWRGNALVVLHNFAGEPLELGLKLSGPGSKVLVNLIEQERSEAEGGVHRIVLGAYGYRWYRVGGLNYALQRQKV